ncbi:MAG: phosphoribosylamine--glycine ligase [Chthoniobacterales bacterium]
MKILVIGSGGREYALGWKLAQSSEVTQLFFAPGNGGTQALGTNVSIDALDTTALLDFAQKEKIDLTLVGPDDALAGGIVDAFEDAGLHIFGPRQAAAQLESSKSFAKDFMLRHGIPCAKSADFTDASEARAYCDAASYPLVVKADGLALGKGVIIAENKETAMDAIHRAMELKVFGEAGTKVLIEEYLEGPECSIHAFVAGDTYLLCPDCRDHKRAFDGDLGPNTGGMGTISPSGVADEKMLKTIREKILDPFVAGLQADGIDFRGMLFPGLMLTKDGPKVLEFNCRFGDPETQVLMRRLESDLTKILLATAENRLSEIDVSWSSKAAACVVQASGGYPGSYQKGHPITGISEAEQRDESVKVFHAGTKIHEEKLVTSGGRVLGITALKDDLPTALKHAYQACKSISFKDHYFRSDIGSTP